MNEREFSNAGSNGPGGFRRENRMRKNYVGIPNCPDIPERNGSGY